MESSIDNMASVGSVSNSVSDPLFFRRSAISKLFVRAIKSVLRALFKLCFQVKINGEEQIPVSGPVLICPNHLSNIDPLLLYAYLPEDTLYIAYEGNFRNPPLSWIIRYGRVLLTTRAGRIPRCFIRAQQGLQQGFSVCLFPEGGRTTSGALMEPRNGVAMLSKQANIPIIPVLIEGSENLLSRLHPGFRFCKIRLTFGSPIDPDDAGNDAVLQKWKVAIGQLQQEVNS